MTLGLATVSASAASYKVKYDDATSIDYKEAADVLSAVGVFNGKGSNFAPKDNLNRGEAAKLVAYLMLGNKTAESIKGNGNKFADVPADHFAAGYIEYLATAGVVSGVGGGNFNPNGQVTAVQFAKMLSVALGYDAQVEGYVGESWNINIMKQANDDELFKTLNVGSNDVLTREQAAQMCLNALKANTVEYESKGDILTLNNSTVVLNAKKAHDKTSSANKATKIDGELLNNGNTSVLQLGEDLYNGDLELRKVGDDFNRPANKWIYKMEEIGTYVNTSDLKAEYHDEIKRGPLYDLVGKSVYDNLVDGKAALFFYEDGMGGAINTYLTKDENVKAVEKFIQKNGDKAINNGSSSGRGSLTQVFVDKNDETTITVINSYVYQAGSDYRASTEDLVISVPTDAKGQKTPGNEKVVNLDTTRLELEDFPMIKDLKKDDYLIVTAYNNGGANYTPKTAVKGELLTGKVEKVVVGDSVTIDGTTYKYEKTATNDIKNNEFSVGQEATVVLDPYGYIVYVDEAVVADNYVFISELFQNGGSTSKVQANAYFTDGTNSDITIKEIDGVSDKTALQSAVGDTTTAITAKDTGTTGVVADQQQYVGWYTYSKNSANEYTLNKLGSGYSTNAQAATGDIDANTDIIKSDTVKFVVGAAPSVKANYKYANTDDVAQANDKTIMVVTYKDKTDVDVYTGVKNIPDITLLNDDANGDGKAVIFSAIKSNYAKYVFVSLEGAYNSFGTESEHLLYVVRYDNQNKIGENKNYYTYKVLDENAKTVLVEFENNITGYDSTNKDVFEAFYKTNKNADGRYTKVEPLPANDTHPKYFSADTNTKNNKIVAEKGTLMIGGDSFTLAKDYKLVYISRSDVLNHDKTGNAEYEANTIDAESLESMVANYDVSYTVQAKLDDNYKDKGGKILEAYVTFGTDAVASTGSSSSASGSDTGILALVLPDDVEAGENIKVYATSKPTAAAVRYVLASMLYDMGYEITDIDTAKDGDGDDATVYELTDAAGYTRKNALFYDGIEKEDLIIAKGLYGTAKTETVTGLVVTKKLTVPEDVTLTVDGDAYIDGVLDIEDGGQVKINGKMILTKNGDVNVKAGGLVDATGKDIEIKKGSDTLTNEGEIIAKNLIVAGDVELSGGKFNVDTVKLEDGAKLAMSDNAQLIANTVTFNFDGSKNESAEIAVSGKASLEVTAIEVVKGATLTLDDNASTTATITVDKGATVAVKSDDVYVASVTLEAGASVTKADGKKETNTSDKSATVSTKSEDAKKDYELKVDIKDENIQLVSVNLTKKSNGVYVVNADTKTVTVVVKASGEKAIEKVPVTVEAKETADTTKKVYTLKSASEMTVNTKSSTITVAVSDEVTGGATLTIGSSTK